MRQNKPPPLIIPNSNFGDATKETSSPAKTKKTSVAQMRQYLPKRRRSEVRNRRKSTKDVKFYADSKVRRKSRSKSFKGQNNQNEEEKNLKVKSETVDNKQQGMTPTASPSADRNLTKNIGKQCAKKGVHFSSAARKEESHVDVVKKAEKDKLRSDTEGRTKEKRRISETQKSVGGSRLPLDDGGKKGHEVGPGLSPCVEPAKVNGQIQRDRMTEKTKPVKDSTKDSNGEPRADKKQGLLEDVDRAVVSKKEVVLNSKKTSKVVGKRPKSEKVAAKDLSSKLHHSKLNEEGGSSINDEADIKEGLTLVMERVALQNDKGANNKRKYRMQTIKATEGEANSKICDDVLEVKARKEKVANEKAKVLKNKGLVTKHNKERTDKTMLLNSPLLSPKTKGEDRGHGNKSAPKSPKTGLSLTNADTAIVIPWDKIGANATSEANIESRGETNKAVLKRKRGSVPKVSELADLRLTLGMMNENDKIAEKKEEAIIIQKKGGDEDLGTDLNDKKSFSRDKVKLSDNKNITDAKRAVYRPGNAKSESPLKQDCGKCDLHELRRKQKIWKESVNEKERSKLSDSVDVIEDKSPIPKMSSEDFPEEHVRKVFGKKELYRSFKQETSKTTLESFKEAEESGNKIDTPKVRENFTNGGSNEQIKAITEGHAEWVRDNRKDKLTDLKSKSNSIDSQRRSKRSLSQSTDEPSPGITEVKTEDVFQELNRRRASVVEIDAQRRFRKLSNALQTPLISPKTKLVFDFPADAKKPNRTRKQSILSTITDPRSMSPRSKKIFNFNTDNMIAFRYSEMPFYCVVDSKCCYRSKTKQEQVKHHVTRHSSQAPFFCITCLKFGSKVAFESRLGLVSHEKELKHDQLPTASSASIR